MKCADCNQLLPSLISGDLSRLHRAEVEAHLAACSVCHRHQEELRQTVGLLHEAGKTIHLPSDFQRTLHEKLRAEAPPKLTIGTRLWWFLERFGFDSTPRLIASAAIALALIALILVPLRQRGEATARVFVPEQTVAASFRIPSHRVAVVQLDFVADVSVDDVEFEVSLPGELEFVDGGQAIPERQIAWKGSLSVGSNPVPVAVRGIRPGRYRVTAHAKGRDVTVSHEVLLEVVPS